MWNISQGFKTELRKQSHQIAARATLLDSAFQEIPDGDFFTAGADDFQDFIIDGNIDIDRDRGTRRTANLTLVNKAGQFTPDNAANYDGKFYVNRNVRLYRGVVLAGGTTLYAPTGTFMIDTVDTLVERNMSVVNLTLSDHWKKFTKSDVTATKTYPISTPFNNVIRDFVSKAGADYPLAPQIDPLTGSNRTIANLQIQRPLVVERGTNRGEELKRLCDIWGIDAYFNVEGRFTTNDRKNPADAQEVWHYYSTPATPEEGMLLSVRRTLTDDNLFNHVFVIGLGNEKIPVIYERKDTDPASVTNISRIGDRVRILEDQTWKTQAQVDAAGIKLWANHFNLFEEVVCDVVCNPALEADDVIRITEPYFAKMDARYRIVSMNVPLTTSRQTIKVARTINA